MTPDALVIGGGCSGLAAATALAARGARIRVLEARAVSGGRSRSWIDPKTGDIEDNGQHLILGCYREFLDFVRRTGALGEVEFHDRLELVLLEPGGREVTFRPGALPRPLDLLWGLVRLRGFPIGDALRARGLVRDLRESGSLGGLSVAGWLERHGQGRAARERFWDPLVLATLNLEAETASAGLLAAVLERALLGGADASRPGFPRAGLSRLVVEPAVEYLRDRGGAVLNRSKVTGIELDGEGRFAAVRTRSGERHRAGAAVLAVPPGAAVRLLPPGAAAFGEDEARALGASTILAVHLWFDRAVCDYPMAGLLGSPYHWVFDRARHGSARPPGYLALVTSAATAMASSNGKELVRDAVEQVGLYLPRARSASLCRFRVLRERQATPVLSPATVRLRPGTRTRCPGLFLAGDWTDTGLPATLEGAAVSGHRAAALVEDAG